MSESEQLPPCPKCAEEYAYEQGALLVCPMCGHEWNADAAVEGNDAAEASITDAVGNVLADGDTVSVVKDLMVKGGGGGTVKVGTKVKASAFSPRPPTGMTSTRQFPASVGCSSSRAW